MTKYTVLVTRISFACQEFTVEASDEESAIVAAEQQALDIIWGTGNVEYESEVIASRVGTVLKDRFGLTINWDKK